MQVYFDIDIDDDEVVRAMNKLVALLSPVGAAAFLNLQVGPWLKKRAGERFANEGDDAVGTWQQLKPATVAFREKDNFPGEHPINRRTGELENWVVDGGWDAYPTAIGGTLRYPKNKPSGELRDKVQTAQVGRASPATHPRPVLGVSETDMLFVLAAYAATVQQVAQ